MTEAKTLAEEAANISIGTDEELDRVVDVLNEILNQEAQLEKKWEPILQDLRDAYHAEVRIRDSALAPLKEAEQILNEKIYKYIATKLDGVKL